MSTIPRVGVTEQLIAALDVPINEPTSQTQRLAHQLARSLDVVTDETEQSFLRARHASAEERRRAEALAAAEEQSLRGAGAQRAAELLPQIERDIDEGRFTEHVGNDDLSIDAYADEIIAPHTAGASPIMAKEMRDRLAPRVIGRLSKLDLDRREQNKEALLRDFVDGVAGAKDPADLTKAAASAVTLGLTPDQARDTIGLGALAVAAEQGDEEAFAVASGFLGGAQALKRSQLKGVLAVAVSKRRVAERQLAEDEIAGVRLKARELNQPVSFEDVRGAIMQRREKLGDERAEQLLSQLDADQHSTLRQTGRLLIAQERENIEATMLQRAREAMVDARSTGGAILSPAVRDQTYTTADGEEHTLTRKQIVRSVVDSELARIARETPDPQQAFARQVEFLSLNDEVHPEWVGPLTSAPSAGSAAFLSADRQMDATNVPRAMVQGFELYKRLKATNPASLARHLRGAEDASIFWARAELAEQFIDRGRPQDALLRAIRADSAPEPAISRTTIAKALDDIAGSRDRNYEDMVDLTGSLAKLLARTGVHTDRAAEKAVEIIERTHRRIGGIWTYTGNHTTPDNLSALSRSAAKRYASAFAGRSPVDPDDLALLPGPVAGMWVMHDVSGATPVPVPEWRRSMVGSFTTADLFRLSMILEVDPEAPIRFYSDDEARAYAQERGGAQATAAMQRVIEKWTGHLDSEQNRNARTARAVQRFEQGVGRTSPRVP